MARRRNPDVDSRQLPPRTPLWVKRLAEGLPDLGDRVHEPAMDVLRRSGRLPTGAPAKAAVLLALVKETRGVGLLLTRRRDDLASHPGQVAFPGGSREGSESAEETALREAQEEIALPPKRVRILGCLPRYPTTSAYLVTPVVGYVANLPPLRAQPEEVADIFVVPVSVLLDASRWESRPLQLGDVRLPHRELHWQGQRIWGATAGMLRLLLPILREARGVAHET